MPQVQPIIHSVTDLKPGDHTCYIYDTDDEHRIIITPFLRKGLEQNEKVVYIADARDPKTIINYLKTDGIDVKHYLKKGQFSILSSTDVYLKGGVFDPDGMMSILSSDIQKALDEGYTALRVTAEMSWALRGLPGSERLMEYEDKSDTFFKGSKFLAICQYDRRCFSNELFHNVLMRHPFAVIGTSIYNNFYYVPPKERANENPSGNQLNSWISNLIDYNKTNEALRESEAKFRLIADNTADNIWIFDMDMHLQYISPSVKKMKGFTVEEVLSQSLEEMMTPESLESLMKRFYQEMALEASGTADPDRTVLFETEEYCKTGATIRVENSVTLLRDAQGRPVRMIGISRDITERRRAEDALRESENIFAAAFRNSPIALTIVSAADGTFVDVNDIFVRDTGYTRKEIIGQTAEKLRIFTDTAEHERMVVTLRKQGYVYRMMMNFRIKTGEIRACQISTRLITKEKKPHFLSTIEDITDRRRAEDALRESEETFKALAENANDGILVALADGAHIYVNRRACEITGYSAAELQKTSIKDLAAPDEIKKISERIRKRLAGEDVSQYYETLIIRKDGKSVPIEFTGAKTFWHGQPSDMVIIRDITERKRAEEALRRERDFAKNIVGTAQTIILILDTKGHIVYLNPYMEEISGYLLEEVKGKDWFEMFLPSHIQESTRSLFLSAVNDIRTCGNVGTIITKDGCERLIEWYDKTLKNADGSIEGLLAIGQDVTDQKQMEEALRKSEEKYRGLIEQTGDGVWIIDRDLRTTFANNRLAEMFGYTPQEMIGKQIREFMPAADMEIHTRRIKERTEGKCDRFEQKFFRKDGSTLWTIASVTPLLAEENRLVGAFAMLTDITDRKRIEDALSESEERFRGVAERSSDLILLVDQRGMATYVSPSVERILEYLPDEIIGKMPEDFIIPEDTPIVREGIKNNVSGSLAEGVLVRFRKKSGGYALMEITTIPMIKKDRVFGIQVIARDITARKKAEEALRESEERYRILTESAHDAIYSLSPEGVVTYVNSAGSALTGMPPEKMVGLSLESLYPPDVAQELRANLDKVISTKRPVRYDLKYSYKNQDMVNWLDAQLVPQFGADGSVVQVMGISRSITDRKQAEFLLMRFNEELESLVRWHTTELERNNTVLENEVIQRTQAEESVRKSLNERELLLREIHHRVRNNFQIILSLISLQSRNIKDPKLLETMGEFQNRIVAMAHVHDRMYRADDISSIELSEICTFLGMNLFKSYKVDRQQIRLSIEMKDLPITIESAIPLSLIINELIINSIKHAFPKGTKGEITITGCRKADSLVLSIKDTGIGIPKNLDWMRNTRSLGLRLVVNLVEQLDGTIELDRSSGTAFTIVVKEKV